MHYTYGDVFVDTVVTLFLVDDWALWLEFSLGAFRVDDRNES